MAPRKTRSQGAPAAQSTDESPITVSQLPPSEERPPQVVILPKNASNEARFVSLICPASNTLERYYFCPQAGLHELKKFAPPTSVPRSWLLTGNKDETGELPGYILKEASMLMATPIDPLFMLLPIFTDMSSQGTPLAKPEEDHFDTLAQTSEHMKALLRRDDFRQLLRSRLTAACSLADAAGEEVYRPDVAKLARTIFMKAEKMVSPGAWPKSLENEFVNKPLQVPQMLSGISFEQPSDPKSGASETSEEIHIKTDAEAQKAVPKAVLSSLRLKTAIDFMLSSYVPSKLRPSIWNALTEQKWVDFTELDDVLAQVAKRKEEVHALRSMSDNISRKRGPEDEEQAEIRAEKKRKKEEDEKKKKQESKALKDLKKVDTSGMKKLSSFFNKAPAKAGA